LRDGFFSAVEMGWGTYPTIQSIQRTFSHKKSSESLSIPILVGRAFGRTPKKGGSAKKKLDDSASMQTDLALLALGILRDNLFYR
jgi:hypothetical protein